MIREKNQIRKPNFFIVGAPRSGTTALFYFLRQHPDICMSDVKEPYYFCTDFHEESDKFHNRQLRFPIRTEESYLRLFGNAVHERVVGEATPDYLYSKLAAKNIYGFNKEAKILISIRNPVDFLYSIHSHLVSYGLEDVSDFKKALDIEPDRKRGGHFPKGVFWPSSLYYSERIKFTEQIRRYLDFFREHQVEIVIFDDFKKDELQIYKRILGFLGVDTGFRPIIKVYNENRVPRFRFAAGLFAVLGDFKATTLVPFRLRRTLSRKLRGLNWKTEERTPMDPDLRKILLKETKHEVEELSKLLRRDLLALWNYDG
jgi:Sulfotransferase domain